MILESFKLSAKNAIVTGQTVIRRAPAVEFSQGYWGEGSAVNLTAVFRLAQLARQTMLKRGERGKILNTASLPWFQGVFSWWMTDGWPVRRIDDLED
jgi:NAD(P)-dependent dehydrogenase (short-subunit alcohol dehydrogenase family)